MVILVSHNRTERNQWFNHSPRGGDIWAFSLPFAPPLLALCELLGKKKSVWGQAVNIVGHGCDSVVLC